jgi:putative membrane protein
MSDKAAYRFTIIASAAIFLVVVLLNSQILPRPAILPNFIFSLPKAIAIINALCSLTLIASFFAIKNKKITLHKNLNLMALLLSVGFLVLYVTVHYLIPDTKFGDLNHNHLLEEEELVKVSGIRTLYLILLLSHILLAAIVLPLVILSFHFGLTNQVERHKKLTRWSFPVWLYVTVTGVIVYFMISPFYPF